MAHNHNHVHGISDAAAGGKLKFAIALTSAVLLAEVLGGVWTRSLALLSDAAHVFMDVFALTLSLIALRLAMRPASDTRTYGLHRAEVLAALINGVTIFLISLGIYHEAWKRLWQPVEIKTGAMMVIAVIGMLANLGAALKLMGHGRRDLNLRSAFLHVLSDFLASVGVVAGGAVILFTGWYIVDPILSVGIATLIIVGSIRVVRESVHILLEGVPRGIHIQEIADTICAVEGVKGVHRLHVWSICSNILSLSSHVIVDDEKIESRDALLMHIRDVLASKYGVAESTLQFHSYETGKEALLMDLQHPEPAHHHHHEDEEDHEQDAGEEKTLY
ncbi:MAG: cation diffusion facilitator family transporter [Planctomycetota bacterium]